MVEHACRCDVVESPAERTEVEDIGLTILDSHQPEFARLSLRMNEAGAAQIDRKQF